MTPRVDEIFSLIKVSDLNQLDSELETLNMNRPICSHEFAPRSGGGGVQPARPGRPRRLRPHQPDPRRQLTQGMALPTGM